MGCETLSFIDMETHYTEVRIIITRGNDKIMADTEDMYGAFMRKKEVGIAKASLKLS